MNDKSFTAVLGVIVPEIVHRIAEETKLWHFSPLTLFNMYDEERNTGGFSFPEEG